MPKKKGELSEFAKYIIENNLARPVEKAFEDYPVEEHGFSEEDFHIYQLQEDDIITIGVNDEEKE